MRHTRCALLSGVQTCALTICFKRAKRDEIGSRALVDHQPLIADRSTPPYLRRSEMRDGVKFIIMFTGKKFPAYRIVDAVGLCRRAVGRYLGETIETDVDPVFSDRGVSDLDAHLSRLDRSNVR